MSLDQLDLIAAEAWSHAAFTSYALSLSFFEAVILEASVRGGSKSTPLVFADVEGVRSSFGEQDATSVGREYAVEPVLVRNGVFHPKLTVPGARGHPPPGCMVGALEPLTPENNMERTSHRKSVVGSLIGNLAET